MKEARVWLVMIVAIAAAAATMMVITPLLRGKVDKNVEIFLPVILSTGVYVAVSRLLGGRRDGP